MKLVVGIVVFSCFGVCILAKLSADVYYLWNRVSRSRNATFFALVFWSYGDAEELMAFDKARIFRYLYKTAQLALLISLLDIVLVGGWILLTK